MPQQKRAITLSYPWYFQQQSEYRYRVEKISNSIEFTPHQYLTKKEVEELIRANWGNVTTFPQNPNK